MVERDTLDEWRDTLGLTPEAAAAIEALAYAPIQRYQANLEKYRQTLDRLIAQGHYPFTAAIEQDLAQRQRDLGLKPEDVARVAHPILDQAELAAQAKQQQLAEAAELQALAQQQQREQAEYAAKLEQYRQEFTRAIQAEYPLNHYVLEGLKGFQQQLGLNHEDVARVERPMRDSIAAKHQENLKQQAAAERQRQIELEQQRQREVQRQQVTANPPAPAGTSPVANSQAKAGAKLQRFEFDVITVNKKGEENSRARKSAEFWAEDLGHGVRLEMVKIPSGSFQMGATGWLLNTNETPRHRVTVPAFLMGKYPVTQAQWRAVAALPQIKIALNADPAHFKGDNRPVEQVSWDDAVEFCQRLSVATGHDYRLPSEAEWEYACRAGTTTDFYFGETLTQNLARCKGNLAVAMFTMFGGETAPVGSYLPNAFGLYDMHGNVGEWCADHWHDSYTGAPIDGSAWIAGGNSESRIRRGGSWFSHPPLCRAAYRNYLNPAPRDQFVGFRVVCAVFPGLL